MNKFHYDNTLIFTSYYMYYRIKVIGKTIHSQNVLVAIKFNISKNSNWNFGNLLIHDLLTLLRILVLKYYANMPASCWFRILHYLFSFRLTLCVVTENLTPQICWLNSCIDNYYLSYSKHIESTICVVNIIQISQFSMEDPC